MGWTEKTKTAAALVLLAGVFLGYSAGAAETATTRLEARGDRGDHGTLELPAAPLRSMTPVPFRLLLQDAAGKSLPGAELTCDLTMPAMPMPPNRPAVGAIGEGYGGEAVFTMAGAWRATFVAAWPEGKRERFVFDLDEVLLK